MSTVDKIQKFFERQSPMTIILWAVILVACIYALYKVYDTVRDSLKGYEETKDYESNSNNLTYSSKWYKESANSLFVAMNGAGTDEDEIFRIINELRTADDWNELVKAFGVRTLDIAWVNQITGNLPACLVEELSTSDLAVIRQKLLSINAEVGF